MNNRALLDIDLELLARVLDLPPDMTIVDMRLSMEREGVIEVKVESPNVAPVERGWVLPKLQARYRVVEGQPVLVELLGYTGDLR